MINLYLDEDLTVRRIADRGHRAVVGGMWDEIGGLQRDFLIGQGLRPRDSVLDIGCGSLRGGVTLAKYLKPRNYYGLDISEALISAGYEHEILAAGLGDRLPRSNLQVTDQFEIPFPRRFRYAIAVSVFTHLTLDYLGRCLTRLHPKMAAGGSFYASFFEGAADMPSITWPSGVVSFPDADPFHFSQDEIRQALPPAWDMEWVGDWSHPRDQRMARFVPV